MIGSKLLIKRAVKTAASIARSGGVLPRAANGAVNILAYHRVAADIVSAERSAYYGLIVSTATFRRHCEMLARSYEVLPLEDAAAVIAGERSSKMPVAAITFDDGYLDFYEQAFPVLRELGLPATVFLPTECIDRGEILSHDRLFWLVKLARERGSALRPIFEAAGLDEAEARRLASIADRFRLAESLVYLPAATRDLVIAAFEDALGDFDDYPGDYRLLDWDQIRELAANGIDFGGHTSNHVVLTLEDETSALAEIADGKRMLEQRLGRAVTTFAYPNGEYDARIRQMVEAAGFSIAVTTEARLNPPGADRLALGRISLCEESTRGIKGVYSSGVAALRLHT